MAAARPADPGVQAGRPPLHDRRELVNAMAYWLRAGWAWRLLPHDLPPWPTVDHAFRSWRQQGLWEQIHHRLQVQERLRQGRPPTPARPSWTARASRPPNGGPHGDDGATRRNGRTRHLLVDTLGLVGNGEVTAADGGDRDGAMALLGRLDRRRFPRLGHGWVDGGYRGPFLDWVHQRRGISFRVVAPRRRAPAALAGVRRDPADPVPVHGGAAPVGGGADLAWLGRFRRLSKDYEYLTATSEQVIYLAMTRLLLRRLTRP